MITLKKFRLASPSLGISVTIPAPKQWDLSQSRPMETNICIDGTSLTTSWTKHISGVKAEYEQIMTEEEYQSLRALDEHTSNTEWTLYADNRTFTVVIDISSAQIEYRNSQQMRNVNMTVTIIDEVSL